MIEFHIGDFVKQQVKDGDVYTDVMTGTHKLVVAAGCLFMESIDSTPKESWVVERIIPCEDIGFIKCYNSNLGYVKMEKKNED